MKKNCLLFTSEYPYGQGETFLENEIDYLSEKFEKVFVFSLDASRIKKKTQRIPSNFTVYPIRVIRNRYIGSILGLFLREKELPIDFTNFKTLFSTSFLRWKICKALKKIQKIIKKNNIDCEDSTLYSFWLSLGLIPGLLKKRLKAKHVLAISRGHGYDIYSEQMPFNYSPYQEKTIDLLDYVFPCSNLGTSYLIKKYGDKNKNKIITKYLGTDDYGKRKGHLSIKTNITFVTCSGIRPVKRIPQFASCFANLFADYPNIRWVCIGDGKEMNKTKKIISDAHLNEFVEFLGQKNNEFVMNYYKTNNVTFFVNVSSSEGIPVSIMEAISFGIPAIATNVGGNPEIVKDGITGFLVKNDLIEKTIKEAITLNDDDYNALCESTRTFWKKHFNKEINYTDWVETISK